MWEMAGATGLDPMPRTMREMVWAYKGHEYAEYERLSIILAQNASIHRDPKKYPRGFRPDDFFRRPVPGDPARQTLKSSIGSMRAAFIKRRD